MNTPLMLPLFGINVTKKKVENKPCFDMQVVAVVVRLIFLFHYLVNEVVICAAGSTLCF